SAIEGDNQGLPVALRIPTKINSQNDVIESLYIEYRNPDRLFENINDSSPLKPGIIAYAVKHPTDIFSHLLNLYPSGNNSNDYNAHIADTSTGLVEFADLGLTFNIESIADTATLVVNPGTACRVDFSAIELNALEPIIRGESVDFEVVISNLDSQPCGTSSYTIKIEENHTDTDIEFESTINPNQSASTTFSVFIPFNLPDDNLVFDTQLIRNHYQYYSDEYNSQETFIFPIIPTKQPTSLSSDSVVVPN